MKKPLMLLIVLCSALILLANCGGGQDKSEAKTSEPPESQAAGIIDSTGALIIENMTKAELDQVYDQIVIGPAPAFLVYDLNQHEIAFDSFKDHVLLLNFWSMDSPVSKRQFKTLSEIQNIFRDRKFTVLGICTDRRPINAIQQAADINRLSYPVAYPSTIDIYQDYAVNGPGKSIIIDHKGNIVGDFYDDPGVSRLQKVIELFLQE